MCGALSPLCFKEALRVQRGHATAGGAGDGLAVEVVLHVAGGKHAGHAGLRGKAGGFAGDDVAAFHVKLAGEGRGVGCVTDGDEAPLQGDVFQRAALHVLHAHAGDAARIAKHFGQRIGRFEHDAPFGGFFAQAIHHDGFGAEGVAAMNECDAPRDAGQIDRFFHGGVAAADDAHVLVAVEKAVAGGAGGHAPSLERFFRGQPEVARRGTGGDDEGVAGVAAGIAREPEGALREVGGADVVAHEARSKARGVRFQARHQVGAEHALRVARPVVHLGSGHQLAAFFQTGKQHGREVGAGGVDGGGVAGGAGAEDEDAGVLGGHDGCFKKMC